MKYKHHTNGLTNQWEDMRLDEVVSRNLCDRWRVFCKSWRGSKLKSIGIVHFEVARDGMLMHEVRWGSNDLRLYRVAKISSARRVRAGDRGRLPLEALSDLSRGRIGHPREVPALERSLAEQLQPISAQTTSQPKGRRHEITMPRFERRMSYASHYRINK